MVEGTEFELAIGGSAACFVGRSECFAAATLQWRPLAPCRAWRFGSPSLLCEAPVTVAGAGRPTPRGVTVHGHSSVPTRPSSLCTTTPTSALLVQAIDGALMPAFVAATEGDDEKRSYSAAGTGRVRIALYPDVGGLVGAHTLLDCYPERCQTK